MTSHSPSYSTRTNIPLIERGLLLLSATAAVASWCVMISRIMSDVHPIWDLASHLSWHVWIALSLSLIMALVGLRIRTDEPRLRWWHRLIMTLPPWLYFTWVTLPWTVLPLAGNNPKADGLKIYSWNIWAMNQLPDEVLKLVRAADADILILIEVTHANTEKLKVLESEYAESHWVPDYTGKGIAVLSKIPGTTFQTLNLADQGMPAIEAELPSTIKSKAMRMIAVHTRSPDLHQRTLDRNLQLEGLTEWIQHSNQPSLIIGDLNITPWSPPFARLIAQGHLKDSRTFRGNFASWPTDLGRFAIPIDHALVANEIEVLYRGVGEIAPDSDHRPISVIVR